jgi:hypothetical protein
MGKFAFAVLFIIGAVLLFRNYGSHFVATRLSLKRKVPPWLDGGKATCPEPTTVRYKVLS